MFSAMQFRSIALTANSRYPMIKFRYGPGREKGSAAITHSSGGSAHQAQAGQVMYDFQLPHRYRRKPLDQKEIDMINGGGAV